MQAYLAEVDDCLALFMQHYGRSDVLRAWRTAELPQSGPLGDGTFEMHGYGCSVERAGETIDFDFAGRDSVGFDAWRLRKFCGPVPDRWNIPPEVSWLKGELEELLAEGKVIRASPAWPGDGNSELFVLPSASPTAQFDDKKIEATTRYIADSRAATNISIPSPPPHG